MIAIIPKAASVKRRRNLNRRHCQRSEAIQTVSVERSRIASLRWQ